MGGQKLESRFLEVKGKVRGGRNKGPRVSQVSRATDPGTTRLATSAQSTARASDVAPWSRHMLWRDSVMSSATRSVATKRATFWKFSWPGVIFKILH
jgi:hypothetical protein